MAELRVDLPTVTVVLASAASCDDVARGAGTGACRVASGEVLIVGEVDVGSVRGGLDDPGALVADVSDGWVRLVIEGADARQALGRVCELRLTDTGWVQGEVARAPAKVLVSPGRLDMLVPAHLAAHVEERVRADAAEVLSP